MTGPQSGKGLFQMLEQLGLSEEEKASTQRGPTQGELISKTQ